MATSIFELEGCTDANLAAVKGSLARIPAWTIFRTAKGAFLLRVEADSAPDGQVQAFLAPLHVKPVRATELPGISGGAS